MLDTGGAWVTDCVVFVCVVWLFWLAVLIAALAGDLVDLRFH